MQEEILSNCRELIRQGKTGQALEALSGFCRQNGHPALNDVLLLSGQYNQHRKDAAMGLAAGAAAENRIAKAVLEILDALDEQPRAPAAPRKSWIYILAAAGVVVLILVIKLLATSGNNTTHGQQSPIIHGNQTTLEYNNNNPPDTNAVPEQK